LSQLLIATKLLSDPLNCMGLFDRLSVAANFHPDEGRHFPGVKANAKERLFGFIQPAIRTGACALFSSAPESRSDQLQITLMRAARVKAE
jgi:hypothetical protein